MLCATRLPKLICVICCNWNCRADGLQQLLVHIHRRGLLSRAHGSCSRESRDQMSSILKPLVIFLLLSGLPKEHSFPIEWFRITPQWNVGFFFFWSSWIHFRSKRTVLPYGEEKKSRDHSFKTHCLLHAFEGTKQRIWAFWCVRLCVYETSRFS